MSNGKVSELLMSPAIVGVIATLASKAVGLDGNVNLYGMTDVSLPVWLGLASFVSSASGQTIKQYLLPLSLRQSESRLVSGLTLPVIVGATNSVILYTLSGDMYKEAFVLGAGSQVAGQYLYDNILKQYMSSGSY